MRALHLYTTQGADPTLDVSRFRFLHGKFPEELAHLSTLLPHNFRLRKHYMQSGLDAMCASERDRPRNRAESVPVHDFTPNLQPARK